MGRLNTLTDTRNTRTLVSGMTYGVANEVLGITSGYTTGVNSETHTYNSMFQLTQLQVGSALNMQYSYSSTQNSGTITSESDVITGEQVAYTYDALNRLASAQTTQPGSTQWGLGYNYDGFGNLTDQNFIKGSVPTMHVTYNASNNLQTGDTADLNGNIGAGYIYDIENRLVQPGSSATAHYAYDTGNKRVWRGDTSSGLDEITFWAGKKLATYGISSSGGVLSFTMTSTRVYFGRKMISAGTYVSFGASDKVALAPIVADRQGSIKKFYPFGVERPSATANDTEKFTGYFRDASTGLDYADQRYHQPGVGRFMTPDRLTGKSSDPGSLNKYAYTGGDPVNRTDRTGQCWDDYNDLFYFPDVPWLYAPEDAFLPISNGGSTSCTHFVVSVAWVGVGAGGNGGGGGESTDPPKQVPCEIHLFYRPIDLPGISLVANHAFLYVVNRTGFSFILEGEPTNNSPSFASILAYYGAGGALPSPWGRLIGVTTPGILGDPNNPSDDPFNTLHLPLLSKSLEQGGVSGYGSICDKVDSLLGWVSTWNSVSTGSYDAINLNSNSFANWLLHDVGLDFGQPPHTPTWNALYPQE
ncbi:MAG: RHS repeat-associated core domain-containing protein [Acidobacteriota bacterium]